ncbi:MAG: ribosomal L7Ae/L30e/S12e/Gadd45 family protein [Nanoarchaeota archaeon]|mgnify:CR=1 FL=1
MAKTTPIQDIKILLEKKQLYLGLTRTLKALKVGKVSKVYLASNTPKEVKSDLTYYGNLSGAQVVTLDQPNVELGVACRKPFPIAVIGVIKE